MQRSVTPTHNLHQKNHPSGASDKLHVTQSKDQQEKPPEGRIVVTPFFIVPGYSAAQNKVTYMTKYTCRGK